MKKPLLIATLTVIAFVANAQKLKEYTASNGMIYHLKDAVRLGIGSAPDGSFLYLQLGGWAAAMSYDENKSNDQFNIGRAYANTAVIIKKISQTKIKGIVKTYFTVGGGNITNYILYIDDAIQTCEVVPCTGGKNNQQLTADKFDQLKKLKDLLDSGAITQSEYDEQKKNLLNQ